MYKEDTSNIKMLKTNISEESKYVEKIKKGYYTNINYQKNLDIINIKFYITVALGVSALAFMIINFIGMILYKKDYYR